MASLIGQMFLSLAAVLAVMALITYAVRRSIGIPSAGRHPAVSVDVLGQRALHPKRSVYVLRVGGSVLVVGSSENGLQMLTELTDPELLRNLEMQKASANEPDRIVLNARSLIARLTGTGNRQPVDGTRAR